MTERSDCTRLADYRPTAYAVEQIELDFELDPDHTRVVARTRFRRREDAAVDLVLHGANLRCESLAIDGRPLTARDGTARPDGLVLHAPPADFVLEAVTILAPRHNTALEGLYMSGGRYCTQCEAEGFRAITYALDRPDVMARYTVRIVADRTTCPTLLSNGNPIQTAELADGRHAAVWHDPHPKPTYLFALAAGSFESLHADFTTRSGHRVALGVHVDPGSAARAHYALDSLQRAMRWDEDRYGREYDLDVFNLVAVRDFNFGAMENKGLNIFNSAYVLADADTATDADYEAIEAIVGHEYFHNWTGNRITCRDWFQLSLKEGLTVYREQEFSGAMRSRAVQRLKDVKRLRLRQFAEDAGPLAHAVRPQSYRKIDNFYTATVYEKGAEVIRMLQQVLGDDAFARGLQLYFTRRDGTASTVEDFVGCLAEAAGVDLAPWLTWYDQAGTPHVHARGQWHAAEGRWTLQVTQHTPPTPGQPHKVALPIPLRIGFVDRTGAVLHARRRGEANARPEHLAVLTTASATLEFEGLEREPVPALLRGFCAPVVLDDGLDDDARRVQMAHDPDPYTRWEAGQSLARQGMLRLAEADAGDHTADAAIARLAGALAHELDRAAADSAFAAIALRLPDLGELMQLAARPDPERLFAARNHVRVGVAEALRDRLLGLVQAPAERPFSPAAPAAARRSLRAAALDLLAALGPAIEPHLLAAHADAGSMAETVALLEALGACGGTGYDDALVAFHARWHSVPLVLDKWFELQASAPRLDAIARVERLRHHPDFTLQNPNRARSLVKAFATRNVRAFHAADGSGYRFVAAAVCDADALNPALAARLLQPFESWRRLDPDRQAHVMAVLTPLRTHAGLSANLREMLDRTLA
jgi:aminopeptidase N